jgi:heme-degrading monooxygenase HmoA
VLLFVIKIKKLFVSNAMKQIFIDKFTVPSKAVDEFNQRMSYNRNYIRKLQGFNKDAAYKRTDENGNLFVITIAEWESEDAFNKAREAVQAEYKRIGFNFAEMSARLNITVDRGIYKELDEKIDQVKVK